MNCPICNKEMNYLFGEQEENALHDEGKQYYDCLDCQKIVKVCFDKECLENIPFEYELKKEVLDVNYKKFKNREEF